MFKLSISAGNLHRLRPRPMVDIRIWRIRDHNWNVFVLVLLDLDFEACFTLFRSRMWGWWLWD
jgi:hypothetical protein